MPTLEVTYNQCTIYLYELCIFTTHCICIIIIITCIIIIMLTIRITLCVDYYACAQSIKCPVPGTKNSYNCYTTTTMIAIMTERKKKETGAAAGTAVRREQTRTSFLKRWFHWSSSRTRRNSKVDQATPPSSPLQAPNSALKRRKSDKDVFVHNNNNNPSFAGDPAAKSATLPTPRSTNKSQKAYFSPRHSIRVRTPNNSPITAICTNTTATNTFTSIAPKRQPGHHHSPITLGNALSTPHSPRHRRPPRNAYDCLQPKQAASFWDISPTAETAAAALRSNKKKQLVRSNSIGNSSSYHDYSEPYHWLFPSSQNEHSFLPPPALPPRPPHIAQEPAGQ